MTHGKNIYSVDVDGRIFIIIIIVIIINEVVFNTLRRQQPAPKSSSLQLTTKGCESFHSHLSKYFYHPHPDIKFFHNQVKIISKRNLRKVTKC